MLAGHVPLHGHFEICHDGLELAHALVPLGLVVGGVGQIAGEDDEVGLLRERVHRPHRLTERVGRLRVGRTLESPVGVGELDEEEIVLPSSRLAEDLRACSRQPRGEDHASESEKLDELATSFGSVHRKPSGVLTRRV